MKTGAINHEDTSIEKTPPQESKRAELQNTLKFSTFFSFQNNQVTMANGVVAQTD